jgi:hypothetical protein
MTYLYSSRLDVAGASGYSAFDELITIPITPVIQLDALYGLLPNQFETYTANGGTVETTNTLMKVHSNTSPGGYGVIRSRRILRYRPGQGALARFTAGFSAPHANTTQRAGLFAQEQALCIGYDGTQFGILRQNGGKAVIYALNLTNPATGTQNVTITLNNVPYVVSINSGTTTQNAVTIANASYPGWTVTQIGPIVYFLSSSVGPQAGTFSFSSAGAATGTMSQTQAGVANTLNWTYQSQWDYDKLDGTGPSGMTLNPLKLNVYQIDFRWLGAGEIRYCIENSVNGNIITFHHEHYSNRNEDVHLDNPSFKLGYIAANITASASTDVHVSGASMLGAVQGTVAHTNYTTSASSGTKTGLASNQYNHLITIRNDTIFNNKINMREFRAQKLSVAADSNDPIELIITFNLPSEAAYAYSQVNTNSCSSISTDTAALTNPKTIASYVIPGGGSGVFDLNDLNIVVPAGNSISVAARSAQAIQSIIASLIWEEV